MEWDEQDYLIDDLLLKILVSRKDLYMYWSLVEEDAS